MIAKIIRSDEQIKCWCI